ISIDSYGYAYQSAVPAEVITACMEEALALYSFYSSPQNTKRQFLQQQGVKSFSLDDLSESYGAVSYTYGLKSPEALELIDKYIEHSPFLV
ncbi:MAG TPA: hypothetical protein VN455_13840, partial [Methanotrichaceae archaeon]|nr:hypothetical protein [Methanotrichaceae archaeon]